MKNAIFIGLLGVLAMTSCKKEGCTNPKAENYSEKAYGDNGTCTFKGRVVFWFNESTSVWLTNQGVSKVFVEIENVIVQEIAVSNYYNNTPSTTDPNTNKAIFDLGKDLYGNTIAVGNKSFIVTDDLGNQLWSDEILVEGGEISDYQLIN